MLVKVMRPHDDLPVGDYEPLPVHKVLGRIAATASFACCRSGNRRVISQEVTVGRGIIVESSSYDSG
jgi:hypothetical protein